MKENAIKIKTKKILLIGLFLFFLFITISQINRLLIKKDSRNKFSDFYTYNGPDYDVLFCGTSHSLNVFSPSDIYDRYGFTSYNMAILANKMATNYWMLKNALQYTTPKLLVLQMMDLPSQEKYPEHYIHVFFDTLPMSRLKIDIARDLFDNPMDAFQRGFFNFSYFHNRWNELTKDDLEYRTNHLMGFVPFFSMQKGVELPQQTVETPTEVTSVSIDYLRKTIELCREKGIEILFFSLPYSIPDETKNANTYVQQIADEYGIPYITADDVLQKINMKTDISDSVVDNSHLNVSGAMKVTSFICPFIKEHFDLPDHRGDPEYAVWDKYAQEYEEFKIQNIHDSKSFYELSVMAYDNDYSYFIEINEPELLLDKAVRDALENIGVDVSRLDGNSPKLILVKDHETKGIQNDSLNENGFTLNTDIGTVRLSFDEKKYKYSVSLDDHFIYSGISGDLYQSKIRLIFFKSETYEFIDNIMWNSESFLDGINGKRKW